MSKIVKVQNGNLRFAVTNDTNQSTSTITLDTGDRTGTTIITGNLIVQGTNTNIESTTSVINDNIIVLNAGEAGTGVTLDKSGIRIDRGWSIPNNYELPSTSMTANGDAELVYVEANGGTPAAFKLAYTETGAYIPLETNAITTGGGDLNLIGTGTSGMVTVTGTVGYESRVLDKDHIPNKKYVDDTIIQYVANTFSGKIQSGDTSISILDNSVTFTPTVIAITLDGTAKALISSGGFTIDSKINLNQNTLSNLTNDNLVLQSANDTIELSGYLQLNDQAVDPTTPVSGNLVYSKTPVGPGNSGIYFSNPVTSGELVQKNRALLWAMLF